MQPPHTVKKSTMVNHDFDPHEVLMSRLTNGDKTDIKLSSNVSTSSYRFVILIAFGVGELRLIGTKKFQQIMLNDPYGVYHASIPVPRSADWYCEEFLEHKPGPHHLPHTQLLSLSYFSLLRLARQEMELHHMDDSEARSDLIRYNLFYYLLFEQDEMKVWSSQVTNTEMDRVTFVYNTTLRFEGKLREECSDEETDAFFIELIHPRWSMVSCWVFKERKS